MGRAEGLYVQLLLAFYNIWNHTEWSFLNDVRRRREYHEPGGDGGRGRNPADPVGAGRFTLDISAAATAARPRMLATAGSILAEVASRWFRSVAASMGCIR
jgi:hypothetical protein